MVSKPLNVFEEGQVILINKPIRWTSFDVVKKIRAVIRVKKVGHAGTLDPLATGLLILCSGRSTKLINQYMAKEKEYTGTFTLGATTPTYDLESQPGNFRPIDNISQAELEKITQAFTGEILQVPPAHSAIKLQGKRVYELARKGEEVVLQPRKIDISLFEIGNREGSQVSFRVICSTGTYIRSLAHDFGQALGCGAYLSSLCRTRIGEFRIEQAISPEEFEAYTRVKLQDPASL